jgi:hypothetical protein
MPGNWDLIQHVNPANGRIEWPTGPIADVHPGFNPRWVEAWVVQGEGLLEDHFWTGPSQSSRQSPWSGFAPDRWTATEPGWTQGQFQAGTASAPEFAVGIALLALRNNAAGTYEYEWWHEIVLLR